MRNDRSGRLYLHTEFTSTANYTSDIKDIDVLTAADMTFKSHVVVLLFLDLVQHFAAFRRALLSINQVVVELRVKVVIFLEL